MSLSAPTVLSVGVVVLLAAAAVAGMTVDRESPLERAVAVAGDAHKFRSADEAAASLLEISRHLRNAGEACDKETAGAAACQRLFASSAYSQVAAASVRRCTPAAIFGVRDALAKHLERIGRGQSSGLPAVPRCV